MTKIIINGLTNLAFPIRNYNRNTNIENEFINSDAYINAEYSEAIVNLINNNNIITSIQILNNDNQTIYSLSDINAKVYNVNEYLEDGHMILNISIRFDNSQDEIEE